MATYEVYKSKHGTTVGNTIDTVTVIHNATSVEVINRSVNTLWFIKGPGSLAAGGDDTEVVPVGASLVVSSPETHTVIQVLVEGGGAYSVVAR